MSKFVKVILVLNLWLFSSVVYADGSDLMKACENINTADSEVNPVELGYCLGFIHGVRSMIENDPNPEENVNY